MKPNPLMCFGLISLALQMNSAAITLASVDSFSSSTEGWRIGIAGTQPSLNAGTSFDGQPGFLTHFSDGVSSNSKWLMWSDASDWLGDYEAAGVTAISFWADNRAGNPLALRIAFDGPGGWFYSDSQTITNASAGDDWLNLVYSLDLSNFTHAAGSGGTGSFADTITGVTRFEILGGNSAIIYRAGGDIIEAGTSVNTVAIDQITAIPEPSTLALLLTGPFFWLARRKR